MLGVIMYATLQHNPHETHTSVTSQPSRTAETLTVSNQPSSNPSIGNKMGHLKGATMGSTMLSTAKPIQYIPIHLHKAIRTIRIIPEGQEDD